MSLLIIVTLILAAPARAEGNLISLDEYWQLVDRSLETITQLEGESPPAARDRLGSLAQEWVAIQGVILPDGKTIPIHANYLADQLNATNPDLARLRQQFSSLQQAQKSYAQGVFDDAELAALLPILMAPEFQWKAEQPNWLQQLIERFLRWLDEFLDKIFGADRGIQVTVGEPALNLSSLIAIAIFAVIVFFVLRSLLGGLISETDLPSGADGDHLPLTAESALQRAQALSSSGDYRSAVRYLYLSSLLLLEERGLLRYDRSKTNREYLQSVADRPKLARPLQTMVDVFDRVWYGFQPLDQAEYQRYEAEVTEIKEQRQ